MTADSTAAPRHRYKAAPEIGDGRSKAARQFGRIRRDLVARLGHEPSLVEAAAIDRAALLIVELQALNAKIAVGTATAEDDAKFEQLTQSFEMISALIERHAAKKLAAEG